MSLTPDQIQTFKKELEARHRQLCEQIAAELKASNEASYIELAGRVHDSGDASVADLIEDISLVNVDRHTNEVRAIERALAAIRTGSYGECPDCGADIDPERLRALPWAARCHDCQQKWEHEHLTDASHGSTF